MKVWKRGIEKETLVLLILALGILVFYVGFHKTTHAYANQSVGVIACKASVERNANLHINGIQFPTSINCPAQNIAITSSDSQNAKNEKIARAMYDCWYAYGQGKLDLYRGEGTFCSVCAFVDVKTDQPVTGLPNYLMTTQVPDKSGLFYSDYLTRFTTPKAGQILGALKDQPVLEDKAQGDLPGKRTYAVLFVYAKGDDALAKVRDAFTLKTFQNKAGLTLGALGGLSVGTTLAGGSALIGLATLGALSGPPGWIIVGTAVVVGAVVGDFFGSPDHPEWAAFTVMREWDPTNTPDLLKNDLGCDYFPTKLE